MQGGLDQPFDGRPNESGDFASSIEDGSTSVLEAAAADGAGAATCAGAARARGAGRGDALQAACSLAVRHDHGSQYMSDVFQTELHFLGIKVRPDFGRTELAYLRPSTIATWLSVCEAAGGGATGGGNGCAERFIRTLKENLLGVHTFDTVEQVRQALLAFRDTYNKTWLIQRLGFQSPAAVRQARLSPAALAA